MHDDRWQLNDLRSPMGRVGQKFGFICSGPHLVSYFFLAMTQRFSRSSFYLNRTKSLSSSANNCFWSLRKAVYLRVRSDVFGVNQLFLGSQHHLEEPLPPVWPPPLTVRLPSYFYPDSYCVTVHPRLSSICVAITNPTPPACIRILPSLGMGFSSRPSYLCSMFRISALHPTNLHSTHFRYVASHKILHHITLQLTSYSQFAFLLTKRHYSYTIQLRACSRWASPLLTSAPFPSRLPQNTHWGCS